MRSWFVSSFILCLGVMGLIIGVSHSPTSQAQAGSGGGVPLPIVHTSPFGAATSHAPVRGVREAPLARKGKRPAVKVTHTDGCNHAYGKTSQCVPISLTSSHACSYLTKRGFFAKPLQVHQDPLHLMSKKNVRMKMGKISTISACTD